MTRIFDRATVNQIKDEMDAALKQVAAKYGVAIDISNARFNEMRFNFKIEVRSVVGVQAAATRIAIKTNGTHYGVGTQFQVRETVYEITGINPKAKKNIYKVVTHTTARAMSRPRLSSKAAV